MRRHLLLLLFLQALHAAPALPAPEDLPEDLSGVGRTFLVDTAYIATAPLRATTRQALVWGGIAAAGVLVYANDEDILDVVRDSRDTFGLKWIYEAGEFFEPLGHMGVMNKYYFGGLALSYVAGQDRMTRIFAEILESHFIAGMAKNVTQSFAGRARPYQDQGSQSWGNDDATSFPSGHSLNVFQLATVLSYHADRTWFTIGAYAIAGTVGIQRIESRSHWPSDVLLSAAFGTAVARCVVRLHEDHGGPRPEVTTTPSGPVLGLAWRF